MINSPTPHGRRHILGGLLGLPLVAALPATASQADRELIDLVDAVMAASDELYTVAIRENWDDARIDAASDRWRAMLGRAVALPATTREGRAAKARLILDQKRGIEDCYDAPLDMLTSLLHDLVAGVGG